VLAPDVPVLLPREAGPIIAWYVVTALAPVIVFYLLQPNLNLISKFGNAAPHPGWLLYFVTLLLIGRYIGSVFGNQSHDLLVLLPIMLDCHQLIRDKNYSAGFWYINERGSSWKRTGQSVAWVRDCDLVNHLPTDCHGDL
jgi:hypothetical protein